MSRNCLPIPSIWVCSRFFLGGGGGGALVTHLCVVFLDSIQHYVIKFVSDCGRSVVFSGYSGFLHQ